MTDKKYVLHYDPTLGYFMDPGPLDDERYFIAVALVDFYRRHPDVEDRTQPNYADVPVGTAGTATVRGVEGVRVIRREPAAFNEDRWGSATAVKDGFYWKDANVTDFVPDRLVPDQLHHVSTSASLRDSIAGPFLTERAAAEARAWIEKAMDRTDLWLVHEDTR